MDVSNTTNTDTQYRPTSSGPKLGDPVWKLLQRGQRVTEADPCCPFTVEFKIGGQVTSVVSRSCEKPMRLVSLVSLKTAKTPFTIRCYPQTNKPSPPPPRKKTRTASPAAHTPPAAQAAR